MMVLAVKAESDQYDEDDHSSYDDLYNSEAARIRKPLLPSWKVI